MITSCPTFWVKIFIAGPLDVAKQVCRKECMREGLCVTVEPTTYIYTGGEEAGVVVGLVNYPRFPSTPAKILKRAEHLAYLLLNEMHQNSVMIQHPTETTWYSRRTDP